MNLLLQRLRLGLFLIVHLAFAPLTTARTPHSCYYNVNDLAPDDFLPCYTSTKSTHYPCCRVGDKCLENNACYDADSGVTYQYGCTDVSFSSPNCPKKCNLDTAKSHWVGLVFCNGTNGLPNDTWVCHHPDNCGGSKKCVSDWSDGISKKPQVGCEDVKHGKEYVAFGASWTLSDVVALPVASRTALWWAANAERYAPTTTSQSTVLTTMATAFTFPSWTANAGSSSPASSSVTPSSTGTVTQPESSNDKAVSLGAGIGLGIGIPVLLCIMSLAFFCIRRQRKKFNAAKERTCLSSSDEKKDTTAHGGHDAQMNSTPIVQSRGWPVMSEVQRSSMIGLALGLPCVSSETVQEDVGTWERQGPLRVHDLSA